MDDKKLVVMIMNCSVQELARFMQRSLIFNQNYTFVCFPNYGNEVDQPEQIKKVLLEVARADVLIVQNVKSTEWLQNDNLSAVAKRTCHIIRLAFWRFDGFWPIFLDRKSQAFWYFSDEFPEQQIFSDYINRDIDQLLTNTHFNSQVEKLRTIDQESDFSMMPFFENNYKKHNLFSDVWHPTAVFYREVARWVLAQLDIHEYIPMLPNNCINRDRYRLVFNSVAATLGMEFDPTYLHFFNRVVSREVWYDFSRYAYGKLPGTSPLDASNLFEDWIKSQPIEDKTINIAIGMPAEQSSLGDRSHANDPARAVSGYISGQFAMRTQVEPSPWWQVDLREFRQLTKLVIWNGDEGNLWRRLETTPMTVSISYDAQHWTVLADIHFPFSGKAGGKPLSLDFVDPITTRYLRIQLSKTVALCLDQVEAYIGATVRA